jgi:hypothetical protein
LDQSCVRFGEKELEREALYRVPQTQEEAGSKK